MDIYTAILAHTKPNNNDPKLTITCPQQPLPLFTIIDYTHLSTTDVPFLTKLQSRSSNRNQRCVPL